MCHKYHTLSRWSCRLESIDRNIQLRVRQKYHQVKEWKGKVFLANVEIEVQGIYEILKHIQMVDYRILEAIKI